ncbi:MAG: Cohesin domain protein [Oscillospiraceae bacterium]|nr:Cohesin domain protein [Oscillospiraceae bacterium]
MKVRKIVAGLAAVSMLAAFSAQGAFAADTVTITADKVEVAAGETFTMNVSLSGVPAAGISVCEFALTYDTEWVTVTGVTVGAIADNGVDSAEPIDGATAFDVDYSTAGVINASYITGLDDSAYWITEDGVFMTITGTVDSTAVEGDTTEFVLGAIQRQTSEGSGVTNDEIAIGNISADYTVTQFDVTTSNGSVTVAGNGTTGDTDPTPGPTTGDDYLAGDVNLDGSVSIVDVVMLNKAVMGVETLNDQQKKNGEVDGDASALGAGDSLTILKHLVDLIPELPLGQ